MTDTSLVPVGTHVFTKDQLQAAIDRTVPNMPPDKTIMVAGSLDQHGTSVAVIFQKDTNLGHWQAKAAFEHDWTGDNRVGAGFTFSR